MDLRLNWRFGFSGFGSQDIYASISASRIDHCNHFRDSIFPSRPYEFDLRLFWAWRAGEADSLPGNGLPSTRATGRSVTSNVRPNHAESASVSKADGILLVTKKKISWTLGRRHMAVVLSRPFRIPRSSGPAERFCSRLQGPFIPITS